ncbi:transcriptional regulator [Streptosporangiaceae bacterium NEAU-GS5]|nr:transcriptional regulator [Streptosporangiaceae bacterium NEAU-GS5]
MPTSPHPTSTDLLVLHTLRCIGFSSLARVSEATGLPEDEVESELIDLAVAGLVTRLRGEFGGWGLTDAGRTADGERIAADLDAVGAREAVTAAYDDFLVLNPELLNLCTAWQTRATEGGMRLNDHSDLFYDMGILDQLAEFDHRADAVLTGLAATLGRFLRYRARLAEALTRARAGALDYVTDNMSSYHSVWFQLHEDLLVTLGIPRHGS